LPRAEGIAVEADTPTEEAPAGGNETILIVEDDDGVRGFVVEALSSCGYRTREARSGTEAIDVLKGEGIELMLTDAIMPGMSGTELMVEARRLRPDLKLLLTSGYSVTEMPLADIAENMPLLRNPIISQSCIALSGKSWVRDVLESPRRGSPASGVFDIRPHPRFWALSRNDRARPFLRVRQGRDWGKTGGAVRSPRRLLSGR
jgi:CheY-like chemotaxis protein